MKSTAQRIMEAITDLDTFDAVQQKFIEETQRNPAWAIERYAGDVIYARAMARLVRPLLAIYTDEGEDAFIEAVKVQQKDATHQLVIGVWRSSSTSMLQNTMNQWEAGAIAKFVDRLRYIRWE